MKTARAGAIRIALYNHKGGVGKTTLTAGIAATLAKRGKKVLLVDTDPQANLSVNFMEEPYLDELFDTSDTTKGKTIWSALRPVVEGDGDFNEIKPHDTAIKNLSLIPGDIRMAEYEEYLADFWGQCFQRKVLGYKVTSALGRYVNAISAKNDYDFIFFDTGPNVGPLNRIILLDCDYFAVPVACDLFSKRALMTLGNKLSQWIQDWEQASEMAPKDIYLMPGKPKLLGYIPQRFKVYRGQLTTKAIHNISKIEKSLFNDLVMVLHQVDPKLAQKTSSGYRLGEIKDYTTLVSQSQTEGIPISVLTSGPEKQRLEAERAFNKITDVILEKTKR